MFKMARALLDLCLAQDWYGTRSPSYLAAACLGAAGCLTGQPWCDQLTLTTGFTWTKLTEGLHAVLSAAVADQVSSFSRSALFLSFRSIVFLITQSTSHQGDMQF